MEKGAGTKEWNTLLRGEILEEEKVGSEGEKERGALHV